MRGKKREQNFELNLVPFIDLLSTLICFLMLTALWNQVGSVNIEQGLGQEAPSASDSKAASLWITMRNNGQVVFKLMDSPGSAASMTDKSYLVGVQGSGWPDIERHASEIKRMVPELKMALIMPDNKVNYGEVIHMMDRLKTLEIGEIGIAPL